jgi:8-oxo-dGTP diphosphatase
MKQPLKEVNVVAAILRRCDEILVTQRGKGSKENCWEFPGGVVEPGEAPEDALKRKIFEELEVEIIVTSLFDTVEYDFPDFHLCMSCYYCTPLNDSTIHLHEEKHKSYRWLHYEQLDSVGWLPSDITVVKKLKNELSLSKWNGELYEDDFVRIPPGVKL